LSVGTQISTKAPICDGDSVIGRSILTTSDRNSWGSALKESTTQKETHDFT